MKKTMFIFMFFISYFSQLCLDYSYFDKKDQINQSCEQANNIGFYMTQECTLDNQLWKMTKFSINTTKDVQQDLFFNDLKFQQLLQDHIELSSSLTDGCYFKRLKFQKNVYQKKVPLSKSLLNYVMNPKNKPLYKSLFWKLDILLKIGLAIQKLHKAGIFHSFLNLNTIKIYDDFFVQIQNYELAAVKSYQSKYYEEVVEIFRYFKMPVPFNFLTEKQLSQNPEYGFYVDLYAFKYIILQVLLEQEYTEKLENEFLEIKLFQVYGKDIYVSKYKKETLNTSIIQRFVDFLQVDSKQSEIQNITIEKLNLKILSLMQQVITGCQKSWNLHVQDIKNYIQKIPNQEQYQDNLYYQTNYHPYSVLFREKIVEYHQYIFDIYELLDDNVAKQLLNHYDKYYEIYKTPIIPKYLSEYKESIDPQSEKQFYQHQYEIHRSNIKAIMRKYEFIDINLQKFFQKYPLSEDITIKLYSDKFDLIKNYKKIVPQYIPKYTYYLDVKLDVYNQWNYYCYSQKLIKSYEEDDEDRYLQNLRHIFPFREDTLSKYDKILMKHPYMSDVQEIRDQDEFFEEVKTHKDKEFQYYFEDESDEDIDIEIKEQQQDQMFEDNEKEKKQFYQFSYKNVEMKQYLNNFIQLFENFKKYQQEQTNDLIDIREKYIQQKQESRLTKITSFVQLNYNDQTFVKCFLKKFIKTTKRLFYRKQIKVTKITSRL